MMHVFFFITTITVLLVGVGIGLIGWRLWSILGHVERLSRSVSDESELIRGDIAHARAKFAAGSQWVAMTGLATSLGKRVFNNRATKKKKTHSSDTEL